MKNIMTICPSANTFQRMQFHSKLCTFSSLNREMMMFPHRMQKWLSTHEGFGGWRLWQMHLLLCVCMCVINQWALQLDTWVCGASQGSGTARNHQINQYTSSNPQLQCVHKSLYRGQILWGIINCSSEMCYIPFKVSKLFIWLFSFFLLYL